MANIIIKKDQPYIEIPMSFARQDGFPLDKYQLFFSLEDATEFAATSPLAYPTFIIGVLDEETGVANNYVIQNDRSLKLLDNYGLTKVVKSEEEMLALKDITVGQTVFRVDKKRTYILINSDPSNIASWSFDDTSLKWGTL